MDEPRYTSEYLMSQLAEVWNLAGSREFWAEPKNLDRAVRAIGFVYLHLDHHPTESEQNRFDATIRNLAMRYALLTAHPPEWLIKVRS